MDGNENDKNCFECKSEVNDDHFYRCDSCLRKIHKTCVNLTTSEVRCMPLQKHLLLFICDDCRKLLARMPYNMVNLWKL